jgi:hypothetical protein
MGTHSQESLSFRLTQAKPIKEIQKIVFRIDRSILKIWVQINKKWFEKVLYI